MLLSHFAQRHVKEKLALTASCDMFPKAWCLEGGCWRSGSESARKCVLELT
jgi:hypothetical protein